MIGMIGTEALRARRAFAVAEGVVDGTDGGTAQAGVAAPRGLPLGGPAHDARAATSAALAAQDAAPEAARLTRPGLRAPQRNALFAGEGRDEAGAQRLGSGVFGDRAMAELAVLMAQVAAQARRVNNEYIAHGLGAQRHSADVQASKAASGGYAQLGGAVFGGVLAVGGAWRSGALKTSAHEMTSVLGAADPAFLKKMAWADVSRIGGESMSQVSQGAGRTAAATLDGEKTIAQSESAIAANFTNVENEAMSRNLGDIQRWLELMMQYLSARLQTNGALAANLRV